MKKLLLVIAIILGEVNGLSAKMFPLTDSIVKPFLFEVDGNEVASSKNLTNVVYIQNQTLTGNNLYEATNIYVGTYVNPQQTQGDVTISSGKTILKANTTYISGTTTVELGAELEITPF